MIKELMNETHAYLTCEPGVRNNKAQAIIFEIGQADWYDRECEATVACSIADARKFAAKILALCEEIEGNDSQ